MRWRAQFAAYASLAWIYFTPVHAQTTDAIKRTIRKKYPTVPQLSTAELADWIQSANRPAPLLIDARSEKEFAVSQLKGALNADSVAAVKSAVTSNAAPIVVYCSVGYRSSAFAEKLQQAGFTNVQNLEGSIFQWANEGRPVYRGNNLVRKVHPFSKKWGQLLDSKFHSD
jgi:rhodanese-related sulfurtransferase